MDTSLTPTVRNNILRTLSTLLVVHYNWGLENPSSPYSIKVQYCIYMRTCILEKTHSILKLIVIKDTILHLTVFDVLDYSLERHNEGI